MTTIKASCPTCGEVELTAADMSLMVCTSAPLSYYSFRCPSCRDEVRKPARDISLLMSGGVKASVWEVPQEALEPRSGAALTYDDCSTLRSSSRTTTTWRRGRGRRATLSPGRGSDDC